MEEVFEYVVLKVHTFRGIIQRQYDGLQNRSRGFESLFPCLLKSKSLDFGFFYCLNMIQLKTIRPLRVSKNNL